MTIPDRTDDMDAVGALLQVALNTIVATYEQANVPLPARQYITVGEPVTDCEQLTVSANQVYFGPPGSDPNALQRCDGPRTCNMTIQLFRIDACANTGGRGTQAPTTEGLTANAITMTRDAWLLMDAADAIAAATYMLGYIGEVTFMDPQGGYVGVHMSYTIMVP